MKIFISAGHHKEEKKDGLGAEEVVINMLVRDECLKLMPDLISVPDDLTLKQTIEWINARADEDDFAFEIHCNANNDTTITGVETYYSNNPNVAQILVDNVARAIGSNNRGAISDAQSYFGSLGFLRQVKCHNSLVEIGYLTNPVERVKLLRHETHVNTAKGIKNALVEIGIWKEKISMMIKVINMLTELLNKLKGRNPIQ